MENKGIPLDYKRYDKIIFCSNTLIEVERIIDDKGFTPILIGKGTNKPKIWINTKTNNGNIELVRNSVPIVNEIEVNYYENDNTMTINLKMNGSKNLILQVEKLNTTPEVTKFDLRTLGYNIYGDSEKLNVGGATISGNTMSNLGVFIGV